MQVKVIESSRNDRSHVSPRIQNKTKQKMTGKKVENKVNDIEEARAFLKARFTRDYTNIYGFEAEQKNIYDLLKRTGELGESNSILLSGPQGSGKRTVSRKNNEICGS